MGVRTQKNSDGSTYIWTWHDDRPQACTRRIVHKEISEEEKQERLASEERCRKMNEKILTEHVSAGSVLAIAQLMDRRRQ